MLRKETVALVKQLLNQGVFTQHKIARIAGLSRRVAHDIHSGEWDAKEQRRLARQTVRPLALETPRKCPECGARIVLLPCQHCLITTTERLPVDPIPPTEDNPDVPCRLDLQADCFRRYAFLLQAKITRGEGTNHQDPSYQGVSTMPFLENARYIRWFLDHFSELQPLLALPAKLAACETFAELWAVLREAGDILAPLIDTFPVRLVSGDCEPEAVLQQQAVEKGIPFDALLRLLPFLIQLVQLLTGNQTEQPLDGPHTEGA